MSGALFIHGNYYAEKIQPLPIYRNTRMMNKYGIQSVDGQLVPEEIIKRPAVELQENFLRFPLENELEQEKEIEKEPDLDQILDDL